MNRCLASPSNGRLTSWTYIMRHLVYGLTDCRLDQANGVQGEKCVVVQAY